MEQAQGWSSHTLTLIHRSSWNWKNTNMRHPEKSWNKTLNGPHTGHGPLSSLCSCKQEDGLGTFRDSFWLYIHTELERSLESSWGEATVVDTIWWKGKGTEEPPDSSKGTFTPRTWMPFSRRSAMPSQVQFPWAFFNKARNQNFMRHALPVWLPCTVLTSRQKVRAVFWIFTQWSQNLQGPHCGLDVKPQLLQWQKALSLKMLQLGN